ncbi:sacsin N-terminal ATP-binding-like domain-containing protein [Butyrivibrio sp. XPD2002]|uniref:sacsin N-terminal ATP-binding-like domain-containing protein n=1 Tax=Butyrivibrio sp. XPD2002 TaxID=1280665 RepID=UPI000413EE17|nr:ATP-binding protein [Butyrivibrio sp. XPD2002]
MAKMAIADQVLQRQDKDGMLRRALERIIQLYTDKSHFVYELLQNAEDAGATKIKFEQYADKLVVLHDGHPFSMDNLQGLCDIGKSDKTDDLNQIGEFGVGFKSVFGICETVRLYSHPSKSDQDAGYHQFAVEIKDFTHPVDIEDQDVDLGYTTKFVFPYSVGFTFSGFTTKEKLNEVLSKRLQNLGITTLLFMKNLQSIDYKIELPKLKTSGSYLLDKVEINDHCSLVSAIGETGVKKENEEVSYLVFSRNVTGIQAGRTIDIAFSVMVDEKGEYTFSPSKSPYISVYFPTETESKLKFIVQGPYRTTPNRSSVPADDKDNIDLAEQTSSLLRDSVIELRDSGKLNFSFLNILPVDSEVFYSAPLFECMFSETEAMMKEEQLLLCKDGTYASADSVKIARGSDFAEVLTEELLTELLDDGTEYHWLPTFLTETNKTYKALYEFLTDVLDIEVIRPENLRNSFNNNRAFLPKRDDEWLVKLYNMYDSVAAAFSKQRGGSNMLTAEFVKTSKGDFVAPYRKSDGSNQNTFYYRGYENASYLPNVFLPSSNTEGMDDIFFVDENILKRCRHFFTEILNLQKPNEYEFFIRDFKKRYEGGEEVSDDQHVTDLKRLLHYRGNSDYREEVTNLIKTYLKLRCIKDGQKVYVNPNKEKVLFSVNAEGMSIEQYYSHIISYPYVDSEFYKIEEIDSDQLKIMGVVEEVATGLDKTNGEYYTGNPGRQPEWTTYKNFRWKLSLDKIDAVLEYISSHPKAPDSMAKSSFIYRFLQNHETMLSGTVYVGGSAPNIPNTYSDIVTKLRQDGPKHKYYGMNWNGKWLFTESGELVSQKEITKRDLHPQLYGDVKPESDLYEILGFAKSEEDQLEEAAKDYDQLDDETKEQFFEIELRRRFGISITDLEKNYGTGVTTADTSQGYTPQEYFEFPSARVKNWDSLRKHAAEVLVFASPVKYEYKVRKIRVSKPDSEIDAYLRSMYRVEGSYKYACQMCHEPVATFEKCQLSTGMEKELDAMYLCMCPNCASEYRRMRSDEYDLQEFLEDINNLDEQDINSNDPVKIQFGNESIWFTQTHIAEIRELMALKDAADEYKEPVVRTSDSDIPEKTVIVDDFEAEEVHAGTDVYKEYIGKRIRHISEGFGVVKSCDGKYFGIEFEKGPKAGKETKYSIEACLSKGLIQLM